MRRIVITMLALAMLLTAFSGCGSKKNVDETGTDAVTEKIEFSDDVAAVITLPDGEGTYDITMDYVNLCINLIVPYIQQGTGSQPGWDQIVLSGGLTARDELINESIREAQFQYAFLSDVKKEGIYTDAEDEAFFEEYVTTLGGEEEYRAILAEVQFSEESLKKYVSYIGAYNAATENACTDEEAAEKYDKEYVTSKHILIQFNDSVSEEDALKKANEVYAKAVNGESFENLIKEYGEDPGQDAEVGYTFTEGTMVDEFYKGTLGLEVGEISEPIKTNYGYHIIKRYSNPQKGTAQYDESIMNIKNLAVSEYMTDAKYNELMESYPIEINESAIQNIDLSMYTTAEITE